MVRLGARSIKDLEGAEIAFEQAIKIWPEHGVAYWCLAHFHERRGKYEKAEHLYKKAIEVDPTDAQAKWRMGDYLKNIGDTQSAQVFNGIHRTRSN